MIKMINWGNETFFEKIERTAHFKFATLLFVVNLFNETMKLVKVGIYMDQNFLFTRII